MNSLTDQQLLRDYVNQRSEAAFAELVRRHVNLVYSAALRMVCDAHQAEDVTQAVFAALALSAEGLKEHPVLSGWLHRTAQNIAAQTVRTDARRRAREQEATAMNELCQPGATWEHIAPHLASMRLLVIGTYQPRRRAIARSLCQTRHHYWHEWTYRRHLG